MNKMRPLQLIWEARHPLQLINKYILDPVYLFLNNIFNTYKKKTNDSVISLQEIIFKAGVIALITSCVVWVSVFLYVAFYYSYMPNIVHSRPVHLQFKPCDEVKGVCSFMSSYVELTKKHQLLMVGQSYRIKLVLDMPESDVNKQLGMFMCCMELRAKGGHLVSGSCRSGILPYRSQLLTFLNTMLFSPLLISGLKEERRMVEIELFSDFEDDQEVPATDVYVEIQSRHIQLYSATLYIEAHFTGLRYLMFHWPMFSAIIGISTNLLFVAFICALSWYHLQSTVEEKFLFDDVNVKSFNDAYLLDSEDLQGSLNFKDEDLGSFEDPTGGVCNIKKELEI